MKLEIPKKIELAANLAILIVAILLGYLLIQKYFLSKNEQPKPTEIVKGTKISLPNMSWHQKQKTLLLVLQKDCSFCTESMSFYKTLIWKPVMPLAQQIK